MALASVFTIHQVPVDVRPLEQAIGATSEAITTSNEAVTAKVQGLVRTLRNRNQQLENAASLAGRVNLALSTATQKRGASLPLVDELARQRDVALGQGQAALALNAQVNEALAEATGSNGLSPVLVQTLVEQRDTAQQERDEALEREAAVLAALKEATGQADGEDPAALVTTLAHQKDEAVAQNEELQHEITEAQEQVQAVNLKNQQLEAQIRALMQMVSSGTARVLALGADLQIDP